MTVRRQLIRTLVPVAGAALACAAFALAPGAGAAPAPAAHSAAAVAPVAHTLPNNAATVGLANARFGGSHKGTRPASLGGKFNINGGNWSGYAAQGSGYSSVTSNWTEPTVTCNSTNDLMAPWVGIDGYGSSSVEQTGVATDCSSGRAVYQAWYEMYPAAPVYYTNTVSAGDHITATVTRSGTTYTLVVNDTTKGWTKTTTKSASAANSSAEVIIESPTAAYPRFGSVSFTNAKVNGGSLSAVNPLALDASNNYGYEDRTSAISGGTSFSISYLRE